MTILSKADRSTYISSYIQISDIFHIGLKLRPFDLFHGWAIVNLNPLEPKDVAVTNLEIWGEKKDPKGGCLKIGWTSLTENPRFFFVCFSSLILTTWPFSTSTLLVWMNIYRYNHFPRHLGATCCSRRESHGSCTVLVSTSATVPEAETASGWAKVIRKKQTGYTWHVVISVGGVLQKVGRPRHRSW